MYEKAIIYDVETKDFAMYLDGELVGFARTHQEAEEALDDLVCEMLTRNSIALYNDVEICRDPAA